MVSLHLGLYYFHKQQHQYFSSILQSTQEYKDRHVGNKVINKKFIYFFLILIEVLFLNKILFLNMKCFDGIFCGGNFPVFSMKNLYPVDQSH